MVDKGKSHLQMDDLGVPLFQETSIYGDSNTIISRMDEESYGQQK